MVDSSSSVTGYSHELDIIQLSFLQGITNALSLSFERYKFNDIDKTSRNLKEFRTIKLHLPRRFGSTYFASLLMKHYDSSVLFTYNDIGKRRFTYDHVSISPSRVFGFNHLNKLEEIDFSETIIIIDNSFMLTKSEKKMLYALKAKFYIFLGQM